jgi:hypothetical protein
MIKITGVIREMSSQEKKETIINLIKKLNIDTNTPDLKVVLAAIDNHMTDKELDNLLEKLNNTLKIYSKLSMSGISMRLSLIYTEFKREVNIKLESMNINSEGYTFDLGLIENGNVMLGRDIFEDSNVKFNLYPLNMDIQEVYILSQITMNILTSKTSSRKPPMPISFDNETTSKVLSSIKGICQREKDNTNISLRNDFDTQEFVIGTLFDLLNIKVVTAVQNRSAEDAFRNLINIYTKLESKIEFRRVEILYLNHMDEAINSIFNILESDLIKIDDMIKVTDIFKKIKFEM